MRIEPMRIKFHKDGTWCIANSCHTCVQLLKKRVLCQLKQTKYKPYKVCKDCHELGHDKNDTLCKVRIERLGKIKQYMLSQTDKTTDEHMDELSKRLNVSTHYCKTLYNTIPPIELCVKVLNMDLFLTRLREMATPCTQCATPLYMIKSNSARSWKGQLLCDICWTAYAEDRVALWAHIYAYKKYQCAICDIAKTSEDQRYHHDHLNMFEKGDSVCSMVNEGRSIEDIYREIDMCQLLCLSCHHIVSEIEIKMGFTRIKQNVTRQFNNGELTEEEYQTQKKEAGAIYTKTMLDKYAELRAILKG